MNHAGQLMQAESQLVLELVELLIAGPEKRVRCEEQTRTGEGACATQSEEIVFPNLTLRVPLCSLW